MKDMHPPTLCLNMIVKNESRVIKRLLESVYDILDAYCICDTGSTDNTIEIIESFFREKNIPGKVVQEPFRNFEYNRSFALKACDEIEADMILLMDADMILWRNKKIEPVKFKQLLTTHDAYYVFQGNENMYYKNTRIVKNRTGVSYKGVTHEYVELPHGTNQGILVKDIIFIQDIGDGGAKSDKFERDVKLLKEGLLENPTNERYMFYLANSLKDLASVQTEQIESQIRSLDNSCKELNHLFKGVPSALGLIKNLEVLKKSIQKEQDGLRYKLLVEAIEWYDKRIKAGGFWEEVWYSHYNIGHAYFHLGEVEKAIYYFQKSFIQYPQRVENIYEIVKYYRETGQNDLAVHFYLMGKKSLDVYKSRDYLFIQKDIYDYKLDFEMSILGYYLNPTNIDMTHLCMEILSQSRPIDGAISRNILSNYKFYTDKLIDLDNGVWREGNWGFLLSNLGKTLISAEEHSADFCSSTPTYCFQKTPHEMYGIVRYVNYTINDTGGYEQKSTIETKNAMARLRYDPNTHEWTVEKEKWLMYETSHNHFYIGLEDVRIHYHPSTDSIYYTSNRGLKEGNMVVEHGKINRISLETQESRFLKIHGQRSVEKNWVMFSYDQDPQPIYMIYQWHPLTIGKIKGDEFQITHTMQTPHLFQYIRGSTNGIVVNDELWFLCHIVSYEERRYYYHIMVILNKHTLEVKRTSKMFTFEREKVEYCLGMDVVGDSIRFGYSIMDRETKYTSVPIRWFY